MEPKEGRATLARVEEVVKTARAVEKKVKYPIRSFKELADALGGEDAEVTYEGKPRKVGHVRRMIPSDYFPIDNTEELIARIADLQARAQPGWPGDLDPGTELDEVPADAGHPGVSNDYKPEPGHSMKAPAVKGWRKND
jgi:hypothetical protein